MEAQRLSGRLRWNHCGSSRGALHATYGRLRLGPAGDGHDPANHLPAGKMPAIEAAALAACDALDGVKDGVIDDPTRCTFSPAVVAVRGTRIGQLPDRAPNCHLAETLRRAADLPEANRFSQVWYRVPKPAGRMGPVGRWTRTGQQPPVRVRLPGRSLHVASGRRVQLPDLQHRPRRAFPR
jgi:hypothetical protein